MYDWDLVDIEIKKSKFPWMNRMLGPRHVASKLDHFLIHDDLLLIGNQIITSNIIPSNISNHNPISLSFQLHQDIEPIPSIFNPL
jgi:hypothetical protein